MSRQDRSHHHHHHTAPKPCPQGPPQARLITMNLSGRFAGREIKGMGQQVLRTILIEKNVGLLFGQQINFSPRLPRHYQYIGGTRAFLICDKTQFRAGDSRQYRQVIRDLQLRGKLPFHYLPEPNYLAVKVRTRHALGKPLMEFIAVSWLTDERQGKTRTLSVFKKILNFAANLSMIEELPVLIGGTFRVSFDDAEQWLPDGFCCYGYHPDSPRRQARSAGQFFVSSSAMMQMEDIKPIVCSGILPEEDTPDPWFNPEDAFYCDPVHATLFELLKAEPAEETPKEEVITPVSHKVQEATHVTYMDDKTTDKDTEFSEDGGKTGLNGAKPTSERPNPATWLLKPVQESNLAELSDYEVDPTGQVKKSGVLKRAPSAPDLYDETLLENNTRCYMQ